MIALPPVLNRVRVPEYLSPSALGSAGDCPLKLVVASLPASEDIDRLAPGPEAAIGSLMHKVLERASTESDAEPERIFDAEYTRLIGEIGRDPRRAQYAELTSTKSRADWIAIKSRIISRASMPQPRRRSGSVGATNVRRTVGPEVLLERSDIRLRGKADRISKLGSNFFEIRDFKTGVVLDQTGRIKREIEIQLVAYGLLLLVAHPGAKIRLVVDDGQEREVAFEPEQQREALAELSRIVGAIPPPGVAMARDLAHPGTNCWGCGVRHVCPSYRDIAPNWWAGYPAGVRLSNDLWGTALEVKPDQHVDLLMSDAAGRRVRITGLDPRHELRAEVVGTRIWMFGLEATGPTSSFRGFKTHPRNFHELPRDRLERRAWGLHLFSD